MTRQVWVLVATGLSAALLIGAFAFQHLGGLAPCQMCIWQRYPHAVAIAIGLAALLLPGRALLSLGALAAATTAGIGIYHTGVERQWWQGPSSCSTSDISGLSAEDLMEQIMAAPLVRCDEVAWSMLGLSMASWNAILSALCVLFWLIAARQSRSPKAA
ncbi:MAG: disulfide bond formation protein B [Pseudomonadota bacterium]